MKRKVLKFFESKIRENNNFDEDKIEKIIYGLESLYIMFFKTLTILLLSYILGIFNDVILLMLFFGLMRLFGFGAHAKKSSDCLFVSMSIFIFFGYLSNVMVLNLYFKIIIFLICIVFYILYAPADTEKRPIISNKRRNVYKMLVIIMSCILISVSFLIDDPIISNIIIISLIMQVIMILPITYKLLGVSYNNYKNFI